MKGDLVTNQTQVDVGQNLTTSIKDFMDAVGGLSLSLKACRESGLTTMDMHQIIMESVPEEDRPAFQAQWPMLSMLLSAL
jgi:hypothetical protein